MNEAGSINTRMVVGLGMTGLSAARWCQRRGYAFDLCDTRPALVNIEQIASEFPDARIFLGDQVSGELLASYDQLIVSPGVPLTLPSIQQAVSQGASVTGDIDLFRQQCDKPLIAITGSNGKSTVTTLVGELLQAAGKSVAVGGNIGVPALDLPQADIYVLELSSFQLETTRALGAQAAVILNLSEDHMDRYQGMNDYLTAKQRIFQAAQHTVVNRDDAATMAPGGKADLSFGLSAPTDAAEFGLSVIDGEYCICRGDAVLVKSSELKVKGLHNLANVMAALALVELAGVNSADVIPCLKSFTGLEHRCQWLGERDGVAFYNDSKGTNVASTLAAIDGLGAATEGNILLLAGGVGKGQDFSPLASSCGQYAGALFAYGEDKQQIADAVAGQCEVSLYANMDEAFRAACDSAKPGDAVLLSPACASFDQFKNYAERGQHFCRLVEAVL
ncbi:MAG: UDP-N-acetylmuramoyl-L-alanine--D-glutamate ligase [Oceanospirillaceae bacterium]|nr:UDP-N-acetylmuramoyl-L-alanine--D-glutamate ligase [Oceanospirillaceae bacterium]MBT11299.1 UDP-N-acetylmuramoyl-L-alanine--D-glutamate ligase [Oceanospirillaceae bacterium]